MNIMRSQELGVRINQVQSSGFEILRDTAAAAAAAAAVAVGDNEV